MLTRQGSASVTAIGIALIVIILVVRTFSTGWLAAWRIFNTPAWTTPFLDGHHLTDVLPCVARGVDVYRDGTCDMLGRTFNYPPIWLLLSRLGISGDDTIPLVIVMEFAAVIVLLMLVRGRTIGCGLFLLWALVSPSICFGFERGNVDLLLFALVGGAVLLLDAGTWRGHAAAATLMMGAIMLKLYPIAIAASVGRDRRWAKFVIAVCLATIVYGSLIYQYIPLIRANTFQMGAVYGSSALFAIPIGNQIARSVAPETRDGIMTGFACVLLIMSLILAVRWTKRNRGLYQLGRNAAGTAFACGAGIYCFTFMLGANLPYRLVFLLLLAPQIDDWFWHLSSRRLALALMIACQAALWMTLAQDVEQVMAQPIHWVLFFGLATILFSDLIESIRPWIYITAKRSIATCSTTTIANNARDRTILP